MAYSYNDEQKSSSANVHIDASKLAEQGGENVESFSWKVIARLEQILGWFNQIGPGGGKVAHAVLADTATSAQSATTAATANTALEATHATSADSATNATNATNATHAMSADSATNATNATNATMATKAIQDGNGNNIESTYAKKSENFIPISTVFYIAGSSIPTGYLKCAGAAISRTTYANLFSIIGTTYGKGDGSTTFNLPNLSSGGGVPDWDNRVDLGSRMAASGYTAPSDGFLIVPCSLDDANRYARIVTPKGTTTNYHWVEGSNEWDKSTWTIPLAKGDKAQFSDNISAEYRICFVPCKNNNLTPIIKY